MAVSRSPQDISKGDWYYEYPSHILLVHQVRGQKADEYIRTDYIKIPWRMIDASRKRRPKQRKR